ncbi:MAG: creatininase family protein [Limnochordia bacterium]|jgi:creatinine amidohydrolase|nr:creatininase family protein [Bacillota bacterium]
MTKDHSPYELEYMTRPEAAECFSKWKTAILPIGATEQHGPHLPLGTDSFIAHHVAVKLAERVQAVVLPVLPMSYSWVWRDIPGSMVLSVDTVKNTIKEIAHSLHRQGCDRLVVFSGHGANDSAMKYAGRELADEIPLEVYYFVYPNLQQIAKRYAKAPLWHGMFHACEFETSWILAIRPDLCHMDKAVAEYPPDDDAFLYHYSSLPMGALSSSGVYGDATKATREKGEVTLGEIIEYMVDVLDRSDSVKDVYKGGK